MCTPLDVVENTREEAASDRTLNQRAPDVRASSHIAHLVKRVWFPHSEYAIVQTWSDCEPYDASLANRDRHLDRHVRNGIMNRIIWLVGAVVIIVFVLGYFGLR
jgi:hypothetical protein